MDMLPSPIDVDSPVDSYGEPIECDGASRPDADHAEQAYWIVLLMRCARFYRVLHMVLVCQCIHASQ